MLDLPEPPAQSGRKGWRSQWRKAVKTKRKTWMAAVGQLEPFENPPKEVRIHAHFRLWNPRDDWNLVADLKPVIDALESRTHRDDRVTWRENAEGIPVYPERGYFQDDKYAKRGRVTQEVDRENRGLTLTIEVLDPNFSPPTPQGGDDGTRNR